MLTKYERFVAWRVKGTSAEKHYFDAALLLDDYIKKVQRIQTIKDDFASKDAPKYKELPPLDTLSFSCLVHLKLTIEEILVSPEYTQNPSEYAIGEAQLLIEMANLLGVLYHSSKNITNANLDSLANIVNSLLSKEILDKTPTLRFSLYILLKVMHNFMDQSKLLNTTAYFLKIDVNDIKSKMINLSDSLEAKSRQAELLNSSNQKSIHDLLNDRFLAILESNEPEHSKIKSLCSDLTEVTQSISSLINARKEQKNIELSIQKVTSLCVLTKENANKLSGKKSFIDLINTNGSVFEDILQNSIDEDAANLKNQLGAYITQLKNPGTSRGVYDSLLGKASFVPAFVWRKTAPEALQDWIDVLPCTLDDTCHIIFKRLARIHLTRLNDRSRCYQIQINEITTQLTMGNAYLEHLWCNETDEDLEILLYLHNCTLEAVLEYVKVSEYIQQCEGQLDLFIVNHDGILVYISNLLARISLFFKTDTATAIDMAREMKKELKQFQIECRKNFVLLQAYGENSLESYQHIKDDCQQYIQSAIPIGLPPIVPLSKEKVQNLARNLKQCTINFKLFKGTEVFPKPFDCKQDESKSSQSPATLTA